MSAKLAAGRPLADGRATRLSEEREIFWFLGIPVYNLHRRVWGGVFFCRNSIVIRYIRDLTGHPRSPGII
jgi:hypothetical protein